MNRRREPSLLSHLAAWLYAPVRVERLVFLRVFLPLIILGFMSSRLVHADFWIGDQGFSVPNLGGDWRQPIYLPPLPGSWAWLFATVMVLSGLATSAGLLSRASALTFAATLAYAALADRLAAFTVSKLAPVVMIALAFSGADVALSVDRWWRTRKADGHKPHVASLRTSGGALRFFQVLLPTFYCASGLCKAQGHWLERSDLLYTHLHDSYQTGVSLWLANHMPAIGWGLLQHTTLAFETLAPLFFGLAVTRPYALAYGLVMHLMIGVMFGPVIWFSLLMMTLLLGAYGPASVFDRGQDAARAE